MTPDDWLEVLVKEQTELGKPTRATLSAFHDWLEDNDYGGQTHEFMEGLRFIIIDRKWPSLVEDQRYWFDHSSFTPDDSRYSCDELPRDLFECLYHVVQPDHDQSDPWIRLPRIHVERDRDALLYAERIWQAHRQFVAKMFEDVGKALARLRTLSGR